MCNANSPSLSNTQSPWLNGWGYFQFVMSPNNRLDQFLPVAATAKQEHQAEGPDEVSTKEHQAIGTGVRAVAVDHLRGLGPQEVTQPPINGDCTVGEIAIRDVLDTAISIRFDIKHPLDSDTAFARRDISDQEGRIPIKGIKLRGGTINVEL